jgi:hypothetical protein
MVGDGPEVSHGARKNRGFQHALGEENAGEILLRSHDPAVPSPGPSPTASASTNHPQLTKGHAPEGFSFIYASIKGPPSR